MSSSKKSYPCHAVLQYFLSGDKKQDAATTTTHIKFLIGMFKTKLLTSELSTI